MSKSKGILIFGGLIVVSVAGYFIYNSYKNSPKVIEKEIKAKKDFNARMRGQYKDIKTVDDFINSVKYVDNSAPFGYNVDSLESKKAYLSTIPINDLKNMYALLNNGLGNNSESDNNTLLKFLQKLYGN